LVHASFFTSIATDIKNWVSLLVQVSVVGGEEEEEGGGGGGGERKRSALHYTLSVILVNRGGESG
jgi:hypothetical protein